MKTHLSIPILMIGVFLTLSCKKGEKDPTFSFLTRKQRLTGSWTITEGSASVTYLNNQDPPQNLDFTFDGSKYKENFTETGGPPTIYVGNYFLTLDIEKDGTFTLSENLNGKTLTASGTWDFTTGVGDAKKKENVVFVINNSSGSDTDEHLFNGLATTFVYKLVELKNKEIIMESADDVFRGTNGNKTEFESSYTFHQ